MCCDVTTVVIDYFPMLTMIFYCQN